MKRFYPKPFPRSTLISKNFLEICVAQPSSFSIRTSLIVRKSVFAFAFISFKSKISIRKLLFLRQRSRENLPLTGIRGSCRWPNLFQVLTATRTSCKVRGSRQRRHRVRVKLARTEFRRGCGYVDSRIVCQHRGSHFREFMAVQVDNHWLCRKQ